MYARAMPAVNSGRSVIDSPPRSSNEYISFDTTSVVSPSERANTAVGSITGTSIRLKPYSRRTRSNVSTTCAKRSAKSRSEEHTSELQSLMRISYAVFCLKQKKKTKKHKQNNPP